MMPKGVNGIWNALDYLTNSLKLGLPIGCLRIYLQEGEVVDEMLQTWLKSSMAQNNHADLKPYLIW